MELVVLCKVEEKQNHILMCMFTMSEVLSFLISQTNVYQVVCVVGDISFLHDTNGLAILKQRYFSYSVVFF